MEEWEGIHSFICSVGLWAIGDLVKLVLAQSGRRTIPDAESKLAHELADCLWSIIVLADAHGVDLEQAFLQTMDDLENHIKKNLVVG